MNLRYASCLLAGMLSTMPCPAAYAEDEKTPLAGEAFHTEMFGKPVDVAARDRRHVTAANLGFEWIPHGPNQLQIVPFGTLFVWRNDETRRLRGTFSGLYNDVQYNLGSRSWDGWEAVFTFNNFIFPSGRSEDVEGRRIRDVEVQWNSVSAGVGIGYRKAIAPYHQDSALEMSLTYEPGYRWFGRTTNTSSRFIVPSDTYEGHVHFRLRADMLDRNTMELPHRGISAGGDVLYGHRAHWQPWGGVVFDTPNAGREKEFTAVSLYGLAAGGVPYVDSGRHRLIASLYGGIGQHLDRFSAFRLPGRPVGYEWEALSRPMLPGFAFTELFPRRYVITDLTYRYQALFFVHPYLRATYALAERPRLTDGGAVALRTDSMPALGAGVISGAPWRSQIELNYSYNFGALREIDGRTSRGGHGIIASWSKEF